MAKKSTSKKSTTKKAASQKKAATKKAPSSKAAKKKSTKKKVAALRRMDPEKLKPIIYTPAVTSQADKKKLFSTMSENVHRSIEVVAERSKKRPVSMYTPAMLRRQLTPHNEIFFQSMLKSIGFRTPSAIEVIAPEGIGSTSFIMDWISRLLDMGFYSIYCECEGKQMDDKRIKRFMDPDPKIAVDKLYAVEWVSARQLTEFDNTLRQTVKDIRARADKDPKTKGKPIFFFADPWGGLMSSGEAKGNSDWGLAANAKKEAPKDTPDGSNFEHAKHAQGMARWLPSFMEQYNCFVIFVNKQNDKIDFNPGPAFMQESPIKNDTRIGGRALRRLCAYRFTMLKLNDLKEKSGLKRTYGHHVRMMSVKNSYGPKFQTCEFTIYTDAFQDTPEYQSPALSYNDRTANWFAARGFLGTKVSDGLYTCDTLGCTAVEPDELMAAFYGRPEEVTHLGSVIGIEGYAHAVQELKPKEDDEPEGQTEDPMPPIDVESEIIPDDDVAAQIEMKEQEDLVPD